MTTLEKAQQYCIQTYVKYPLELVRGEGRYVWDSEGKKYLDFYGGHAVCLMGHCVPEIIAAVEKQSRELMFYSNIFDTAPAADLAEKLAKTLLPAAYRVYFANSGSEANETAIKIARKHMGRTKLVSFHHAFHGRSMTTVAVTGLPSYHQFHPDFDSYTTFVELGDIAATKAAITEETAAVIVEPIQSIGGVNMAEASFYQALEAECRKKGALLIFDEVQTGLGRTGTMWFAQYLGVTPDIITTAKGIAGGLPLSVVLVSTEVAAKIKVGDHATTFGGGPVVCAAGNAVMDILSQAGFLDAVMQKEQMIRDGLARFPEVVRVRGKGLLLGIEFVEPMEKLVEKCMESGLILGSSYEKNVYRLFPPLTVTLPEIAEFLRLFGQVLNSYRS